jgi:hypothetical protein
MRKLAYLGAAAAIGLVTAVAASPASADSDAVLTSGATGAGGGTNVTVGDTLTAGLASGTTTTFFDANGKGVTCTGAAFSATVTANPTVGSGDATESVDGLSFSGCTSNISGVRSVKSITIDNLPYSGDVSDTAGTITITGSVHATIVLNLVIGTATCKYTGPTGGVVGSAVASSNSLDFVNQAFTKDTGSWSGCPSPENFTASFSPVVDPTAGGASVYVN